MSKHSCHYFTSWSVGFLVVSVILSIICRSPMTLGVLAAAVANTAVVSVSGPAVLSYGEVEGTCKKQHVGNLLLHAVPMLAAFFILCVWKERGSASVHWAVGSLVVLDVAWALCPHGGRILFDKANVLYGVDGPVWSTAIALAQAATLMLVLCT